MSAMSVNENQYDKLFIWRLKGLTRSSTLLLSSVSNFECNLLGTQVALPYLHLIRVLDLTSLPIQSLSGLPRIPHIVRFVADHTKIASLENFEAIKGVRFVSMKGTPISKSKTLRRELVSVLGPDLINVNGKSISHQLRQKVADREASEQNELSAILAEDEPEDLGCFEEALQKLHKIHDSIVTEGKALFGIIEDEKHHQQFVGELSQILESVGYTNLTTDDEIIEAVKDLLEDSVSSSDSTFSL